MKYKVGDFVRVRDDLTFYKRYGVEWFVPDMKKYASMELEVERVEGNCYYLCGAECWAFTDEMLEPAHSSIHIIRDGHITLAIQKVGNKVTKRGKAVCAPEDTYSFEIGAMLALARLIGGGAS